jgi:hypothetical protein
MKQATHARIAVRAMGLIEDDPETAGLNAEAEAGRRKS